MTLSQLEIQIIAVLTAIACSLLGVFLVLRKSALISDAISHSILPGLVIGFLWTQDLNSPLLIILAALNGLLTVILVEWIQKTGLVKEDTAIGMVFPALFSLGIILITQNANQIHLDTDAVLLGELAFAPFDRLMWNGIDLGPKSAWVMFLILTSILSLIILFYKELKISTFDAGLATTLGFMPAVLHYGLMMMSSITIVGAFDTVGSILVVGFMIVPAALAFLLTNNLKYMLIYAAILAAISAVVGYWIAHYLDASIAGTIMCVMGIFFILVYLFSPEHGKFTQKIKRKKRQEEVNLLTLLIHLQNHKESSERNIAHLQEHINWSSEKANKIVQLAMEQQFIDLNKEEIKLTKTGFAFAEERTAYYLAK